MPAFARAVMLACRQSVGSVWSDWATGLVIPQPTMAMSLALISDHVVLVLLERDIGLTRPFERGDGALDGRPTAGGLAFGRALRLRLPDGPHGQTDVHVVDGDARDLLATERGGGALEEDGGVDERLGLGLAVVADRGDDRIAGDDALVGDLDV